MMNLIAPAVAATLGALYLDAKYYLSTDIQAMRTTKKTQEDVAATIMGFLKKDGNASGYRGMERAIAEHPNHVALISEGREWTYTQVGQEVDKLGGWILAQGCKKGDMVNIVMGNSAEIYFTIYALLKVGITGALINYHLAGAPLVHCLKTSGAAITLCTSACNASLNALGQSVLRDELNTQCYVFDAYSNHENPSIFEEKYRMPLLELSKMSSFALPSTWVRPKIMHTDPAMLIYTSGTTGMPKGAVIPHVIYFTVMWIAPKQGSMEQSDRVYCPMPLFHGSASVITMGNTVGCAATFIIAKKFRASTFIQECVEYDATAFVYVGEMVRYLMGTPEGPKDRQHRLRLALGNGLRPDIWNQFRARFGIHKIMEVYAQTEGIYSSRNLNISENGSGKVGRIGKIQQWFDDSVAIIKHDGEEGKVVRNPKTGFCIRVKPGTPGEIIGQIYPTTIQRPYYKNPAATEKKILRDVFVKGDVWFRMDDIMMIDKDGWLVFCDRMGDTFRWKGENVATDEVTLHMGVHPDIADVAVYGLPLKAYEGQAGMAAVTLRDSANVDKFMANVYPFLIKRGVPDYACPRFIRLMDVITQTHTHKHQKAKLRADGIAAETTNGDRLYVLDVASRSYVTLDDMHRKLVNEGKARL